MTINKAKKEVAYKKREEIHSLAEKFLSFQSHRRDIFKSTGIFPDFSTTVALPTPYKPLKSGKISQAFPVCPEFMTKIIYTSRESCTNSWQTRILELW